MFCSFCNNEIERGLGLMYVYRDGSTLYLCSSKCKRNMLLLGREGRLQKWTAKTVALVHEKKVVKKEESFLTKQIEEKLAEKAGAKPAPKK